MKTFTTIDSIFMPGSREPAPLPKSTFKRLLNEGYLSGPVDGDYLVSLETMSEAVELVIREANEGTKYMAKRDILANRRDVVEEAVHLCLFFVLLATRHMANQIAGLTEEIREQDEHA